MVGFNSTNTTADDGLVDEVSKLKPVIAVTNLEASRDFNSASACCITFEVPSNEVPEGVLTAMATNP
ncbi:hypothetical protein D3C87_1801570 [compost metagenome]